MPVAPRRAPVLVLIFLRRSRDEAADPWVLAKVRLFSIAAALAVGGMFLDLPWLIWLALAALAVGVLLRFLPHPADSRTGGRNDETAEGEMADGPRDPSSDRAENRSGHRTGEGTGGGGGPDSRD